MTINDKTLHGHERFDELAAMGQLHALTALEQAELTAHLHNCAECREAFQQYQVLSKRGFVELSADYSWSEFTENWDEAAVRGKLSAQVKEDSQKVIPLEHRPCAQTQSAGRAYMTWMLRGAAAACIALVAGLSGFYLRGRTDTKIRQVANSVAASAEDRVQQLSKEKDSLNQLLAVQDQKLVSLQSEASQQQQYRGTLRAQLVELQARSSELAEARESSEEQAKEASQQRDTLAARLHDAEAAYQNVRTELTNLRAERDHTALRLTSLEMRVDQLSAANRDDEAKLKNQQDFLSHDRDIRELMGARNLYIADVYDVDSNSKKRAPFGRVFYTKGKSLVFYAFDLDHESAVKDAVFQAWGEKDLPEGRKEQPVNLGILYLDNQENRRWALRCDDPKQLAQIEAVFVTVEPFGGSQKPSSKAFLYALLRKEVNHP